MIHDLIIIGGSAAGITSGIYAARRGLKFKLIAKDLGGEVATSGEIGNWPGMPKTDGIELARLFKEHLASYGSEIGEGVYVKKITKADDGTFSLEIDSDQIKAKAVIISTGVHPRELNVPGEKDFRGRGVTYCTTCDGPLFGGKVVATIGGGNAAMESGLMMSDIASKVYVINKNVSFKGEQVLIENLAKRSNVEIIYEALTTEIVGDKFVNGIRYKDKNGNTIDLVVEGVFVHIGQIPNSSLAPDDVEKDAYGQIKVNARCETNVPGIFAAGDVTNVAYKQIVIACGQGCIAALSAVEYLNRLVTEK
ncbi:MAG: Alkyl hydroperoxide reductase, F subunit [Candidatus Yanofskybacteria bacterium GW2011_GWF1_44_227]|uniref:Alkyl hydroperoxide reductase, F subunit n=1 Tax=Candidatus Yanofskybacteria bacterium GW2011_GWE2_40_11 TaxID=1619033 RepID=A0A0G0QK50_9BACT|nr:MAG: Alkyl hydroperoxide reductase, F subunit [Candidatus Yanofskybacteria bacterium GW2011_GWE1_40_10]KKR40523.1 MAG: Alkyl hydroperoxide reductase, F subunit [Candidatus Yanofskybacteria bacterium GW2011_GWE2_40_11]KKT14680.1 MAG: Alkyl hydroperoxide reductase, F subunit [Candidatus Yanofskybacteria bacterium GW2011_GWF2_43_596]KKT52790.1 MAG: Alkyl hydroperoxide reductase, F subunit [Candidatus Yanofskybacteria bacterium GW2011_GWF1_44_227]HAU07514.1 alkyl hydroperoxide reductase [Candida